MASGEIRLEGARAYLVGDIDHGLRQMLDQVNLSRLSHGVRAAAMMRRCWNEALFAARGRHAFGHNVVDFALMRRQLMKILVPTEQALSMVCFAAAVMPEAHRGDERAAATLRIVTALLKLRACRDNVRVASAAMEVRGGNGYIEDWVAPRLVRDAQVGLLWEGTSNINALDAIQRAVGRARAHEALADTLTTMIHDAPDLPATLCEALEKAMERALRQAERVADRAHGDEALVRAAASALYDAASAVLLAWEGAALGARAGDARRVLLARMVLDHRLSPRDPLEQRTHPGEQAAIDALLGDAALTPRALATLLAATPRQDGVDGTRA